MCVSVCFAKFEVKFRIILCELEHIAVNVVFSAINASKTPPSHCLSRNVQIFLNISILYMQMHKWYGGW